MLGQVCINQAFSEANLWHLQTKSNIIFGLAYKKKLLFGQVLYTAVVMLICYNLELAKIINEKNKGRVKQNSKQNTATHIICVHWYIDVS